MYISNAFDQFDPHNEQIPRDFLRVLYDAGDRARSILRNRSNGEIVNAAQTLDWIVGTIHSSPFDRRDEYPPIWESMHPDDYGYLRHIRDNGATDARVIWELREHFELGDKEEFPQASWPEYFAALSLAYIALALEHQKELFEKEKDSPYKYVNWHPVAAFTGEAIEAICLAEQIKGRESELKELEEKVREKISLRNASAAIARHAKGNSIKKRFIDFFYENENTLPSRRQAALKFYQDLPEDKKRTICPSNSEENAIRTLTDALRAYERIPEAATTD